MYNTYGWPEGPAIVQSYPQILKFKQLRRKKVHNPYGWHRFRLPAYSLTQVCRSVAEAEGRIGLRQILEGLRKFLAGENFIQGLLLFHSGLRGGH